MKTKPKFDRTKTRLWLIYAGRKKLLSFRATLIEADGVFDMVFASGEHRSLALYHDRRAMANLASSGSITDGISER